MMPFHWLQYILLVIIWRSLAGFIQGVDVAWLLFQDKLRKGSQGWWSSLVTNVPGLRVWNHPGALLSEHGACKSNR